MNTSRFLALLLASATTCALAVGCAASDEESSEVESGDGTTAEDDIVAERQLMGGELPQKTISLTFDDGPGARTSELADFLAEKGIKGTFFINGMKVSGRQGAIDRIVSRGHLLANHTQNHKQLTSLGASSIVSEIAQTDAIIAEAQPNGPWLVRAPFGAWNGNVARAVNASNMRKYVGSIFWDEGGALTNSAAADWDCWGKGVSVQKCADLYLNEIRTKKKGIVLLHDIHDRTVELTKIVVPTLIAEGYKFVGVDEVPSVRRSIDGNSGGASPPANDQCQSATLGRAVDENVCVQSRSTEKWSRCVDGEWIGSTGPADTACKERFAL